MRQTVGMVTRRHRRTPLIATAVLALSAGLFATPLGAQAATADPVTFADASLKTCVTSALGVSPSSTVTQGQLGSLRTLSCVSKGIRDITPLKYATTLTSLNLASNSIVDAKPLASATALTSLLLQHNDVVIVPPFAWPANLRTLNIAYNHIQDLRWQLPAGLTSLTVTGQTIKLPATNPGEYTYPGRIWSSSGAELPSSITSGSIAGYRTGEAVIWREAGIGRIQWKSTVPYGDGLTTTYSGGFSQIVTTVPVVNSSRPTLEGSGTVGSTLVAHKNTWSPAKVRYTYQWLRNGVPISGATDVRYTVTAADRSTVLSAAVTGSLPPKYSPTTVATAGRRVT